MRKGKDEQHGSFDLLLSVASSVMHSQGLHSFTIIHMPERSGREKSPCIKIKNERKEDRQKKRLSVGSDI